MDSLMVFSRRLDEPTVLEREHLHRTAFGAVQVCREEANFANFLKFIRAIRTLAYFALRISFLEKAM